MATSPERMQDTELEPPASSPKTRPFPLWRVLLWGMVLVLVNVYWITLTEVRWNDLDGTSLPLFVTPVFLLFVLVLLNLAWRKLRGAQAGLKQAELLLIYIMMVISCTMAGSDTLQNLFGSLGHAYWNATPSNRWQQLFFRYLPPGLLVTDHDALAGFYQGNVSIYSPEGQRYLLAWLVPLTVWGVFFLTLFGMYLCINILIRRAWIENEKLTFPIVQLPIAMTADDAGTAFFKSPIMWGGFVLAFSVEILNGLQTLFPALPSVNIKIYQLAPYFTTPPWNAIGSTLSSFYPFAIGIAYFMPLDLSLSCWLFFILARVFRIGGSAYGLAAQGSGFPYFPEQATGAWLGLALMLIYAGRTYWRNVLVAAFQGARADDPAEAWRYRWAIGGLVLGIVLLGMFSAVIGLSPWVALGFYGVVFLLGFVMTRVRAEFGTPHEIYFVQPGQVLVTVFGTQALGPQNLTLISVLYWFNRCYRNHPMPNQLEAFKMMENKRGSTFGGLVGVLSVAAVVSLLVTYWANLHFTYALGASAKMQYFKFFPGAETYSRLESWLTHPTPPADTGMYYILGGFLFVVALSVLRVSVDWWPLHPAGYALAISYAMEYFWLPVFIAWLIKLVIMRYGGVKLYRAAIPFFLGLILGDYTAGSIWAIIGPVIHSTTYKIFL